MRKRNRESGIGALGILFSLVVFAAVILIGLKLLPLYMESFKVDHALKGTLEDPNLRNMSKKDIAFAVVKRLDIDGEYRIKESNWTDYLDIGKERELVSIHAKWRAETPILFNISLVADFAKEVSNRP